MNERIVFAFLLGLLAGGALMGPLDRWLRRHHQPATSGAAEITKPSEPSDDSSVDYCYIETLHEDPSADNPLGPRKSYESLWGHTPGSSFGRLIPGGFADSTNQR